MQKIQFRLFFIFIFALVFTSQSLFSQEIVKEVSLVYDISLFTLKNPTPVKSFDGASFSVFVKGNLSRTDMTTGIGTESNIYNDNIKAGFILKEYSGQKLMITLTEANWMSRNQFFSDMSFEEVTDNETTVNGFKCKSAKASKLSDSHVTDIYFMKDYRITNTHYYNCFSNLPGIPVKYSVKKDDKIFVYSLKSVSYDNIISSKFDEPQTGYRKVTFDEAIKLKGQEK